ncbi:hypothetical protein [Paraburkholderia sp. A3RO-2L]|uniref:hypothetical protein n=1 Tax=unclassified Paraburkholderia TaxID=2615204 RepID=UPI0032FCD13F|nr:hypothetical protein [Burkholderia vietnamiensis]
MGIAFFFMLVWLASLFLNGWAATFLWNWYLVPVGLHPLTSIAEAIGIGCAVALFQPMPRGDGRPQAVLLASIAHPLLLLGLGWLVHCFM